MHSEMLISKRNICLHYNVHKILLFFFQTNILRYVLYHHQLHIKFGNNKSVHILYITILVSVLCTNNFTWWKYYLKLGFQKLFYLNDKTPEFLFQVIYTKSSKLCQTVINYNNTQCGFKPYTFVGITITCINNEQKDDALKSWLS